MDAETIKEGAKAVQEVAKTTGQALELTKGFSGWMGEVVGRPIAEAVGYYVTDRIQAKRIEAAIYDKTRFVELLRKVNGLIDIDQLTVRPIPPKVSIPLLEAATMEFDDHLQTLWAHLLASAIDADHDPVERQYVSILSELSATDAEALEQFWRESFELSKQKPVREGPVVYGPTIDTGSYGDHVAANLTRLGLLTAGNMQIEIYVPGGHNRYGDYGPEQIPVKVPGEFRFAVLTDLGRDFCRAVGIRKAGDGQ